jgi:hypothetical protein
LERVVTYQVDLERANSLLGALSTTAHLTQADEAFIGFHLDDGSNESSPMSTIRVSQRCFERNCNRSRANI